MFKKIMPKETRLIMFIVAVVLLSATSLFAQGPGTLWTRTYGGTGIDYGYSVQQTTDGGYIIAGYTDSYGAGGYDVYLIKTDASGDTLWAKTYGGTNSDEGYSVQQTTDSGYIIAGYTDSYGAGYEDVYLIKTDASGDTLWTKTYGGISSDYGYSVQQTTDSGYIIAGYTNSFGAGGYDVYLIKTDASGGTLWTKTYGGAADDYGYSVQQTADSGYIIAGFTKSYGAGGADVYLIKTDASGGALWTRTYGGTGWDEGYSVQQTTDGGYIINGWTKSYGAGGADVYLIKTDASGDTLWTKTYGGTDDDEGYSVQQTTDGGYIIAGRTDSYGAGGGDVYLIKTDASGGTLWTKTYGGTSTDLGKSVQQTTDGGYIIVGYTYSYGAGGYDVYLIKTNSLELISPDGGENWVGGSNQSIIWRCEDSTVVDHYRLLYSTDGGSSYPDTIASGISNTDSTYDWTTPMITSDSVRVKVQAIGAGNEVLAEDRSNGNFEIDATPPATITDLQIIDKTYNSITLQWTAPGDDSLSGDNATEYDIRYSFEPITDSNWSSATQCDSEPAPGTPGGTQTFVVKPLLTDTLYYFAMKTRDNVYNWSGLSNVASDSTKPYPILAGSQYPMFHYNLAHTGRSPYYGYLSNNVKWYFATGNPVIGSPVVGPDSIMYFASENDTLYAVNIYGTRKWARDLGYATKSTPAIAVDSTIYIGDDYGKLHAYRHDGYSKWQYDVSGSIVSSPVIGSDGTIYFGSTNDTLYAVNVDGTLKWKFATGGDILSSPAISPDGIVYVGSNDNKLYAINPDGTEAWSVWTPDAFISSPAIDTATGKIYVGSCNGKLYAINPNGTIANTFTTGDTITSSPAIGDSTIFVGSYDGKVYALDKNLNLKWSYQTGGKIESSPAIDANGHIYIGSDDSTFYCFTGSDSTMVWSALTGDKVTSSPAMASNSCIYVGSNDGRLYTFGPNAPVQVILPNGGEHWQKNTVQNIYWGTTGTITNIKLRYSLDSGTSWHVISDSVINNGMYSWTVPDTTSSHCRVKVIAFDNSGDSAIDISDGDFTISLTGIKENPGHGVIFAVQNCPNPIRGVTEIRYGVPKDANVNISIYNLLGQKVATLVSENKKPGYYTARWDARVLNSGIYFIRFKAGSFEQTKKAVLTR